MYEDGVNKYTSEFLKQMQGLPLYRKIALTQNRIIEWKAFFQGEVAVSFSGGKDSTVLLHLARTMFPEMKAAYIDTGLEYPEIRRFATSFENVDVIRPKMRFDKVVSEYGYPLISKEVAEAIFYSRRIVPKSEPGLAPISRRRTLMDQWTSDVGSVARGDRTVVRKQLELLGERPEIGGDGVKKSIFNKKKWLPLAQLAPFRISHKCCGVMKKSPAHSYQTKSGKKFMTATLAEESRVRALAWLRVGCNSFNPKRYTSTPMAFWTEQDVLRYLVEYDVPIAEPYGSIEEVNGHLQCTGCQRTGCVFCAFGLHLDKGESRFERLARTHPRMYEYCIEGGQWVDNPDYDPTNSGKPDAMGWTDWNPKKIWVPSEKGLGMKFVFDTVNEIYGKKLMRY